MIALQELIHRLEVAGGIRSFRRYFYGTAAILAVLALFATYNYRCFRNLATQEAMDSAQLGRNLAEGQGYTTHFVRPFSMFLLERAGEKHPALAADGRPDPFRIRGPHPDISNPPLYPVVLAGLMSVLPFNYQAERTSWFWSFRTAEGPRFVRFQPDFLIALFNEALFVGCIVMVFFLARKLFDPTVAWVSAILMLGTELLWRFSVSGLSTMLLMFIFLVLAWVLLLLDEEVGDEKRPLGRAVLLAVAAGLLVGAGGLTRYSFGWLVLPVAAWLVVFGGRNRWLLALSACLAFTLVLAPWVIRNLGLSGTPFGTAGYAIIDGSRFFPEYNLQRSLDPSLALPQNVGGILVYKLVTHLRNLVQNDLPRLGGTWVSAFFLAGLVIAYHKPSVRRFRYFILGCLPVLAIAQALGGTQLADASPEINSENLLVLLTPFIILYGVSLFFLLLDTVELPFPEARSMAIGGFCLVASLPLVLALLPPRASPVSWPPYHPPTIQKAANWMKPGELTMSDMPWAVAWYGHRQSVWLTINPGKDFLAINDYQKPVQLLFLTPLTTDTRLYSGVVMGGQANWGAFALQCFSMRTAPKGFPLGVMQTNWLPQFLVLADWERWYKPSGESAGPGAAKP